jgi:hypothetical protein
MHFKVLSTCYYIMGAACIAIGGILEWQAKQDENTHVESKAAEVPDAP